MRTGTGNAHWRKYATFSRWLSGDNRPIAVLFFGIILLFLAIIVWNPKGVMKVFVFILGYEKATAMSSSNRRQSKQIFFIWEYAVVPMTIHSPITWRHPDLVVKVYAFACFYWWYFEPHRPRSSACCLKIMRLQVRWVRVWLLVIRTTCKTDVQVYSAYCSWKPLPNSRFDLHSEIQFKL